MTKVVGPFAWRRKTIRHRVLIRCRSRFTFQPERGAAFSGMLHALAAGMLRFPLPDAREAAGAFKVYRWRDTPRSIQRFFVRPSQAWPGDVVILWQASAPHATEFWVERPPDNQHLAALLEDIDETNARDALIKFVLDLFLAMNIASPGCAQLLDGVVVRGTEVLERIESQLPDAFDLAADTAARTGWPAVTIMPIEQVWSWLLQQQGFIHGYGGGATGRAVNALTHLLNDAGPPLRLFWSMVAIESLFTTGEQGMTQQVRERTQLLLGSSRIAAKSVSKMYSIRSKFVHGKLDFDGAHHRLDPPEDDEVRVAADTALAIVTATLQNMITKNWHELTFSTTLSGRATADSRSA